MSTITANQSPNDNQTIYIQYSGGNVQYKIDSGAWTTISTVAADGKWPVTISNSSSTNATLQVIFTTDITLGISTGATTNYFIAGSDNIQFGSASLNADGSRPTITIPDTPGFLGLIRNGTSGTNGKTNVTIYNLIVSSSGTTTLGTAAGWVAQAYFGRGTTDNLIVNCRSTGAIASGGGGICGQQVASNSGSLTVRGCSSSGATTAGAGGIFATPNANSSGTTITAEYCWSSGTMGTNCGGIFGNGCGTGGGTANATNCYSTGALSNPNCGGIFGIYCGTNTGSATATNCYSTGAISGGSTVSNYCGGIFGTGAGGVGVGASNGSATASNCFSTGTISASRGGIFAVSYSATTAFATNCYTSGSTAGGTADGIYAGSSSDNPSGLGTNNYAEGNHSNGGWDDTNVTLTGKPSSTPYGTTWSQPNGANTAYVLSKSAYSPYTTSLGYTSSDTVAIGSSSDVGLTSGYTYSILEIDGSTASTYPTITINASTGALSTTALTDLAVYTVVIYSTQSISYAITTYTLTVTEIPVVSQTTTTTTNSCCVTETAIKDLPYEIITNVRTGNVLLSEYNVNPQMKFNSYADYAKFKMAQNSTWG